MLPARNRITGNSRLSASLMTALFAIAVIAIALVTSGTWSAQASGLGQTQAQSKGQEQGQGQNQNPMQTKGEQPQAINPDEVFYPVQEGFESGNLENSTFHSVVATCVPIGCGWRDVNDHAHSGSYAVYAPDVDNVSDQQLVLDTRFIIPDASYDVTLSFWHRYSFETNGNSHYDGGVLEVSTDNGANWGYAPSGFITGGYNSTIYTGTGNPLAGRPAWGGNTAGAFVQVQASLLAYAGEAVLLRFREATDASLGGGGWWIDDIQLRVGSLMECNTAAWFPAQAYPLTAAYSAGVSLNAKLYVFGGLDSQGAKLASAYQYDPRYGSWTPVAPLPAARYGAAAVTDGTYIYIYGGADENGQSTSTLWRYDPVADTYTPRASFAHPAVLFGAAYLNGAIYRIAGYDGLTSIDTAEVYIIGTNTWSPLTNYPQVAGAPSAIAYNGYVHTAGGHNNATGSSTNKTYRYNLATNAWDDAPIADLPEPSNSMNGDFLNGRWVLVGARPSTLDDSVLAWDPATDSWTSLPNVLQGYYSSAVGAIGQSLHVVGGQDYNNYRTSYHQRYLEVPCHSCLTQFTDVPEGSTFYEHIHCLACQGIISGYGDGTFRPSNNVTRGQIAKIISNAAAYSEPHSTQTFEDIPTSHTFYIYIERLASRGIISGYPCGGPGEPCGPGNLPYFRSNNNASRGQLSKITCMTFGCAGSPSGQIFEDVPTNHTYYVVTAQLSFLGAINGYPCGGPGEPCGPGNLPYFRPGANVSRGQTAKIVSTTFFPSCHALSPEE